MLPYGAFDLQASHPIYPNATNYFPLRRADNESQYTLGRVLLQEAYIIVDYERGNFSLHRALFPASNDKAQVFPILSPEPTHKGINNTEPREKPELNHGRPLSKGTIAAIVLGTVLAVLCLLLLVLVPKLWSKTRKGNSPRTESLPGFVNIPEPTRFAREMDGLSSSELSGCLSPRMLSDDRAKSIRIPELPVDVPLRCTNTSSDK